MGKEVVFLFGILIIGFAFMSFVMAEGNDTNNPANFSCTDSDGGKDYYVKGLTKQLGGGCWNVTENNETENNETDDNDDDDSDDDETEEDGRGRDNKVCCMTTETNDDNETKTEYEWEDATSCLEADEDDEGEVKEIVNNSLCRVKVRERQRIKFEDRTDQECTEGCTCRGVVMTCEVEGGREMTIFTRSGNIIIQIQGINVTTNVTLYKVNDSIVGNFTRGERRIILPDEARERIRNKVKSSLEDDENLTLNEDGFYEVEGKKKARLFWIFSVREAVRAEVDAENGEVKVRNPWWGFLANDREED